MIASCCVRFPLTSPSARLFSAWAIVQRATPITLGVSAAGRSGAELVDEVDVGKVVGEGGSEAEKTRNRTKSVVRDDSSLELCFSPIYESIRTSIAYMF